MNRRQELQATKHRLQKVAQLTTNRICSECPERKPTWASLLKPPVAGGHMIGVLCCYRCYSFHFSLGKQICVVKNIKIAEEWTNEEIEAMERGGGNQMVNSIYEAMLQTSHYDKSLVLQDEDLDATYRQKFVRDKYQELKYFDVHLYHQQLQQHQHQQLAHSSSSSSSSSKENHGAAAPNLAAPTVIRDAARRCKSFDDNNQYQHQQQPASSALAAAAEMDRSKDFVRKPLRRRSQSFKEEIWTTDDDRESTDDDDKPMGYQMPGHLVQGGGGLGGGPGGLGGGGGIRRQQKQQQQRRQSMPLQSNMNNDDANSMAREKAKLSSRERRQRRASIRESLHKEAQERRASQTGASLPIPLTTTNIVDLGYGNHHANEEDAKNNESDATCRRSNRRRRDSMSRADGGVVSSRRSTVRRMSMPSVIAGGTAMHDNIASGCPSTAPKMPTRCISDDDSAGEDSEFDGDDNFTDVEQTPPPPQQLPIVTPPKSRRVRRMSMPVFATSSDDDDDDDDEDFHGNKTTNLQRSSDPTTSGHKLSPYGMDLGYGYDDVVVRNDIAKPPTEQIPKPRRMSTRGSSTGTVRRGSCAGTHNGTLKSVKTQGLPVGGDKNHLSQDLLVVPPSTETAARKEKRRSKKDAANTSSKDKRHRRTIRRCSTGGAVDNFGTEPNQSPTTPGLEESSTSRGNTNDKTEVDLGYEEEMLNWVPPESPNVPTPPKQARPRRRGSLGGESVGSSRSKTRAQPALTTADSRKQTSRYTSQGQGTLASAKPTVSTNDLGYEDLGYGQDARSLPSSEDLGYGNSDEHETRVSEEELDYEDLGYGIPHRNSNRDDDRMPSERRMSRRGSSAGVHHRAGRRLSATQGGHSQPTSRSSSRSRRPSVGGGVPQPQHRPPSLRQERRPSSVGGGRQGRRRSSVGGGASSLLSNPPSMLGGGRSTLIRSDSVSSICSEVSVNAALLYAGDKKYNNQDTVDGLVPVSVHSILDQSESTSVSEDQPDVISVSEETESTESPPKRQSKKDYWKAKLADKSKADTRKDIDLLSSNERRARRRLSVGLAA